MRVLVLGANGQVGRCLVEARYADSIQVIGAGRRDADLTQLDMVTAIVARFSPDLVVNAAAYTAVDKAESDRETAFAVNAIAVGHLAGLTAQRNIPLLHISTDYVFDGAKSQPYREVDPIAPLGVYGASKAAGEALLSAHNPQHIILRTSWVYAAHGNNFIKTMLRLGRERDRINVVADQHGTPTSAQDIAGTLLKLVERYRTAPIGQAQIWGTYHYTAEGETTWHGLAEHVFADMARRSGRRPHCTPITTSEYPTPARRPANSRLDCSKFDRVFKISRTPWQSSVDIALSQLAMQP